MNTEILLYGMIALVLVLLALILGRMRRGQRRAGQAATGAAPRWISRRPEDLEAGVEYCELRADFNYIDEKPATSRVMVFYFGGDQNRHDLIADRMTESQFSGQRQALKREGWREAYKRSDREGESYYFSRRKP
jgi:hypothetical protein